MTKYTQKQLREFVRNGHARDITDADNNKRNDIEAEEGFYTQIGYSIGIYGCNGALLKGHATGQLYAITRRTSALFIFV